MERIAIFAALQWECQPVLRQMHQVRRERLDVFTVWRGVRQQREIWLVKTGIGMLRAGAAARATTAAGSFDLFASTGCAGALASTLVPGDLAVATEVLGDSLGAFKVAEAAHARARLAAEQVAVRASAGPILCSAHVLATVAAKREAAAAGSIAVEMEGAAIAACAAAAGIPFLAVRAILDTADMELPHAGKFIEPASGSIKPFALAGYLATHPGALPQLLAMQRMRTAAQRSLEKFFGAWLDDDSFSSPSRISSPHLASPGRRGI